MVENSIKSDARVLILGFSCVAVPDGFAEKLRIKLQNSGVKNVFLAGLGGLSPSIIPIAFQKINAQHGPFTHVLLEIGTSIYSENTQDNAEQARDLAFECLHQVSVTGAKPAVVLLYRQSMQPFVVNWNDVVSQVCEQYAVPVVNLAEQLVASRGIDFVNSLLRDNVHTSEAGSEYQAAEIFEQLNDWFSGSAAPQMVPRPRHFRKSISLAHFGETRGLFSKQHYCFEYAKIRTSESLVVKFMMPVRGIAFTFIFGPWAGDIQVTIDNSRPFVVHAVDERSYYERLGMRNFSILPGRSLSRICFTQLPDRPTGLKLLKGSFSDGGLEARLVDLIVYE